MSNYSLITIIGPTASGKTRLAVECASKLNGEILSGDSRQIYSGMDIGTGKDLEEYGNISYHLIDICNAGERYDLYRYLNEFHKILSDIEKRGKVPILCGGSGLYVESAISGMILPDVPKNELLRKTLSGKSINELKLILEQYKTLHNVTDLDSPARAIRAIEIQKYYKDNPLAALMSDRKRATPINTLIIGVSIDREARRERITSRLKDRLQNGMVEEIERLLSSGITKEDLIYYGLEYKYVTMYACGDISYDEMFNSLETAIHQFAKRQMTWFRGMERRGFKISWIPYNLPAEDFVHEVQKLYCQ